METSEESNLESNKIHVFPIKKSSTTAPVVVQEARSTTCLSVCTSHHYHSHLCLSGLTCLYLKKKE